MLIPPTEVIGILSAKAEGAATAMTVAGRKVDNATTFRRIIFVSFRELSGTSRRGDAYIRAGVIGSAAHTAQPETARPLTGGAIGRRSGTHPS